MAFHSDSLNRNSNQSKQLRFIAPLKAAGAVFVTGAFLTLVQPDLPVLIGAAAVTSLSLTFVSVLQTPDSWAKSTPKLDGIYAVLMAMMMMIAFQVSGGSAISAFAILSALMLGELIISALIAAGVSSLSGMYQASINMALIVHGRAFGLLGRAG